MKNFDIALQRLKNQRLSSPNLTQAADAVHWLGAVQGILIVSSKTKVDSP